MKKINKYNNKGFTFIELLVYMAVVSFIMVALINLAWNIIGSGAKSATQQEVYSNARLLSEKIKYEIRNCNGINTGASNFDTNLALNQSNQISLINDAPNNPTIFNVVNGTVMIKRGAGSVVGLNSSDTEITNLTFSNYTSADNKTKNVNFILSIRYRYSGSRQEFQESLNLEGGAEVRSN